MKCLQEHIFQNGASTGTEDVSDDADVHIDDRHGTLHHLVQLVMDPLCAAQEHVLLCGHGDEDEGTPGSPAGPEGWSAGWEVE